GHGSRFTVTLPRRTKTTVSAAAAGQRKHTEAAAAHLLVIEDDSDTLEMLRATLEKHGFRVTACESAAESLRTAQRESADLIISDIGMPEMDGFEMIKELRSSDDYRTVPAIALSGYASRKDVRTALAAGFDAHVSKPVDPAELLTLIRSLLKKSSESQQRTVSE